jgi:hypothetical protein
VTLDSVVVIDRWLGYVLLKKKMYEHNVQNISQSDEMAAEIFPHVDFVVSLIKRGLTGIHQGAVSPKHLAGYSDEYTFLSPDAVDCIRRTDVTPKVCRLFLSNHYMRYELERIGYHAKSD